MVGEGQKRAKAEDSRAVKTLQALLPSLSPSSPLSPHLTVLPGGTGQLIFIFSGQLSCFLALPKVAMIHHSFSRKKPNTSGISHHVRHNLMRGQVIEEKGSMWC